MAKRRTVFDDGFQSYLTEGATFVGDAGIPMLMKLDNVQIPKDLVSFGKIKSCRNKRKYVHFYQFDKRFSSVLTATTKYLEDLKLYDGVITPDCSMLIGQSPCLQQANTYMNRAVGFFLQKNGIPVIPNIRWSDESSFKYCFLGVHPGTVVCVSPHGCLDNPKLRRMFGIGLEAMLDALYPPVVLVHGAMPDDVFGQFKVQTEFFRYPSEIERSHSKEGD
ncbi:MAG: DUF4417 domain-containing protein [Clostridia bacterium]|nr:DUF4417 domain-containing protein [Clostridia bacterium]